MVSKLMPNQDLEVSILNKDSRSRSDDATKANQYEGNMECNSETQRNEIIIKRDHIKKVQKTFCMKDAKVSNIVFIKVI